MSWRDLETSYGGVAQVLACLYLVVGAWSQSARYEEDDFGRFDLCECAVRGGCTERGLPHTSLL